MPYGIYRLLGGAYGQNSGVGFDCANNAAGGRVRFAFSLADRDYVNTTDAANDNGSLGTGWLGGLHINFGEVVSQWLSQSAPFVGVLDGLGSSTFSLPPGAFPGVSGLKIYAVSLGLDPFSTAVTELSEPVGFVFP